MSSYSSLSAYLLAVKLRSSKTLLVEGISDKKVLSHYLLKKNHSDSVTANYCIDDASLIDDKSFGPVGAKDKIVKIAENLTLGNFRCLVDREWEGLDISNMEYSNTLTLSNTFITKGHSIENYWFTAQSFIDFIIHTHNSDVTEKYLAKIDNCYLSILQFAAAYSLACRDFSVIARANEMLSHENVLFDSNEFYASSCIDAKIASRGQPCELSTAVNSMLERTKIFELTQVQWICHGHLGEQAIRACIGKLAQLEGYSPHVINSIEYGFKLEKLKLDSDHITLLSEQASSPLSEVLEWVRS